MKLESRFKSKFRLSLLKWYQKNKRLLPWRRTRDPYAIWISEIMLQQTQVATVIPYFERFLKKFPTPSRLARAKEEEVLALWSGLGYYRRAKLLHRGVKKVQSQFKGRLPQDAEELIKIPGIGPYTAGAIASIAFGMPHPVVDGNVIRVLSRIFLLKGHAKEIALQKRAWALAEDLLDPKNPGDFNQAMMELGATTCRPWLPACERCPLQVFCGAYKKDRPEEYPETPPVKKTLRLHRAVAVCRRGAEILLVKRENPRWFQGLWELPHDYLDETAAAQSALQAFLKRELGVFLENFEEVPTTFHSITHHKISSLAWQGEMQGRVRSKGLFTEARFFKPRELNESALSNFDRKVLIAAKALTY
jgi:A/G-specific adenine glycosylase